MYASLSVMHCSAVTHLIALTTVLLQSAGELVIAPQNAVAKVGDTTYFNCSTNLTSVDINWRHGQDYLSSGDSIVSKKYEVRFEIDTNASNGAYNLVIHSVEPGDAGEYICFEVKAQAPPKRSAKLVVLENDPECQSNLQSDGVVGQNVFNIPADDVQLTCNVTYYGNTPPRMEWIKVGDGGPIKENVTSELKPNNRLIYSLKLKGDISLHESSYICQTSTSAQNQYNCTSETIRVLYFVGGNTTQQNVVRGDKITCITNNNSTFPCASQWYHDNYNTCPFSCDEAITAHLLGEYRCRLKCHFRRTDYYFDTMKVVVVETPTPPQTGKIVAVTLVSIAFVIIMAVLITVSVLFYKKELISKERELLIRLLDKKAQCTICKRNVANKDIAVKLHQPLESNHDLVEDQGANKDIDVKQDEPLKPIHNLKKDPVCEIDELAEGKRELFFEQNIPANTTSEGMITGMAILDEELFIVREKKSALEVYNLTSIKPEARIKTGDYNLRDICCTSTFRRVKGLGTALDICSCKVSICLYIMHEKMFCILEEVLKISKDGKVLKRWLTKDNAKGNLSVTEEGNVVITVHDKHMLLEYSPEGKFLRRINLPPECMYPLHAIKVANNQYYVSHGSLIEHVHRVCLVNGKGEVEKSFGHAIGCGDDQLNMPYYLAVGSNGCVTVVDLFNDRLLSLNSNLKSTAKIKLPHDHGFIFPTGICQDEELLVVVVFNRAQEEKKSTKEEPECSTALMNKLEDKYKLLVYAPKLLVK